MNDRELLELAARAAGIELQWESDGTIQNRMNRPTIPYFCQGLSSAIDWNPLTDDGDAMRLAVKAKIDIEHNDPWDNSPWVLASRRGCEGCFSPVSRIEDDFDEQHREAATRRAIVLAAAEIGRGMK